jgi:cleavage and polyadenylation specificity factor subunit 1
MWMLRVALINIQVITSHLINTSCIFHFVETNPPKSRLECVAQYSLFGNIVSMQSVNLANSPRDALLLAFTDAKLSVVEYDPESHDLKTLSLHYFEEDDMKVLFA